MCEFSLHAPKYGVKAYNYVSINTMVEIELIACVNLVNSVYKSESIA
jgi:hypothetical protein